MTATDRLLPVRFTLSLSPSVCHGLSLSYASVQLVSPFPSPLTSRFPSPLPAHDFHPLPTLLGHTIWARFAPVGNCSFVHLSSQGSTITLPLQPPTKSATLPHAMERFSLCSKHSVVRGFMNNAFCSPDTRSGQSWAHRDPTAG